MKKKELLFSLSKNKGDFVVSTFKSGGKGGQHQNKTDSGTRVTHPASGCFAESRSERSQKTNIKLAFKRLIAQDKFQQWLRLESARQSGELANIERKVNESMNEKNLKIEIKEDGKWKNLKDKNIL